MDYMAEHLNAGGRAGIIVPEGIIFQSQNAHKQLRKKLVEECLVAVVSLPGGVFNPYSGVKTSILLLDRALARKTDRIAFFKVANDGFDLGAQRQPIEGNELRQVRDEIVAYLKLLRAGDSQQAAVALAAERGAEYAASGTQPRNGLIVEKERVAEEGEYNLSGERYRKTTIASSSFPIVALGDVAEIISGQSPPGKSYNGEGVGTPFYQGKTEFGDMFIGEPVKWTTDPRRFAEQRDILMSVRAPVGPVNFTSQRICIGRGLAAIRPSDGYLHSKFAFYVLRGMESEITGSAGAAFASINKGDIEKIQMPLPPLEVQQEIVEEIEGYQKVIDGARAVVENYRPHIHVDPDWPMVAIRDLCESGRGRVISKRDIENNPGPYPVYSPQTSNHGIFGYLGTYDFDGEYVTWTTDGANAGAIFHRTGKFNCTNVCGTLRRRRDAKQPIEMRFLAQVLGQVAKPYVVQVGNPKLMNKEVVKIPVPIPSLATQRLIVDGLRSEQALVDTNSELIERFEKKIQDSLARVWGQDYTQSYTTRRAND